MQLVLANGMVAVRERGKLALPPLLFHTQYPASSVKKNEKI
jgi:hypothetical protein